MATIHYQFIGESGCSYHRQLCPARFCTPDLAPLGHEITCGPGMPKSVEWIALHGLPEPAGIVEMALRRRKGQKFLWSLDDDWTTIPDWNPANPGEYGMAAWDVFKAISDHIIVSTPAIAKTLADVAHKVSVCPNLLDLEAFPPWTQDAQEHEVKLPIKVGWAGGVTHKKDVEVLVEPLDRLMRKFPPRDVQFVWFGPTPPAQLVREHLGRGLVWQPMEKFPLYQPMVNSIRPDVWLAPLDRCDFNAAKSSLRVIEAWGLQAVPVATPHGEYNCVRPGVDGRLADDADGWVSAISRLIADHAYRLELAREGRYRVEQGYNWGRHSCRLPWLQAFAKCFGCETP